jgi:hypothetical protein
MAEIDSFADCYLSVAEMARRIGVGRATMFRLLDADHPWWSVDDRRVGRNRRNPVANLARWRVDVAVPTVKEIVRSRQEPAKRPSQDETASGGMPSQVETTSMAGRPSQVETLLQDQRTSHSTSGSGGGGADHLHLDPVGSERKPEKEVEGDDPHSDFDGGPSEGDSFDGDPDGRLGVDRSVEVPSDEDPIDVAADDTSDGDAFEGEPTGWTFGPSPEQQAGKFLTFFDHWAAQAVSSLDVPPRTRRRLLPGSGRPTYDHRQSDVAAVAKVVRRLAYRLRDRFDEVKATRLAASEMSLDAQSWIERQVALAVGAERPVREVLRVSMFLRDYEEAAHESSGRP